MNEERKKWALHWLYNHCSHKWFGLAVLDRRINKDSSLTEEYSTTEIHSLFETLRKEEYIFLVINQYGHPCFILNEMKEMEWLEKIEDTAPTKERIIGNFLRKESFIWYREIVTSVIGGVIGGVIGFILAQALSK